MNTYLKLERTEQAQKIAVFTGEGAYHGSTKTRDNSVDKTLILPEVAEMLPTSLTKYLGNKNTTFEMFQATFPNLYDVKKVLPIPTQEEIRNDAVTFCWCPLEQAIREAGPLTKSVLQEMEKDLERKKKFVYIDSKIQYFEAGDLPVDSKLWHVDGTIAVRDRRVQDLGYTLLHDMKARMLGSAAPPKYLAYQSSYHCATEFVTEPISVTLPDFIPHFEGLDHLVRELNPTILAQPAGSIVSFDGFSLHRAVPAQAAGWRLWVRAVETDREVNLNSSIINCYGTVFRENQLIELIDN